ncbi:MAG: tyrosine--tRNA ligase [Alphaproteobacteria bacterium]|nr:tyrosine--tRNA ligase [Alphaproteobacteria bacterium]
MSTYTSEFMRIMEERGFIHQCTDAGGLDARLGKDRVVAYIGFDCTAASLHVGSLMQIMVLRWLQKTGHKPIILLGGGTSRVGDPSGKDESRKLLTAEDIEANMASIKNVFEPFITFGTGPTDATLVNNAEWLDGLNYINFLRDFGKFFSVNRMLTQDSVKQRLEREQNLSFLEFNYMILQAYDFVELHNRYGCALQIGGSDQWGNIVMGIDLNRRIDGEKRFQPMKLEKIAGATMKATTVQPMIQTKRANQSDYSTESFMNYMNEDGSRDVYGLTTPLLTTSAGAKMGKTASGAVWLNADMLSAYDYWQYWRNTEDADVGRFLRLFTDLPIEEIQKLEALKGADINEAKKILATEVTALLHGEHAAKQAADTAKKTFEQGGVGEDIPVFAITLADLGKGIASYDLLLRAGLASSGGDAKRLIRGGGARAADKKIEDENALITPRMFGKECELKLSAGKKKHVLVKLK